MHVTQKIVVFCVLIIVILCPIVFSNDLASLKAEGDKFFNDRDNLDAISKSIQAYTKALQLDENNKEILVQLTIAYFWQGNDMLNDDSKAQDRMDAYQKGMDYAEKLCQLDPKSVEGNFWHATNNASRSREKGFFSSALALKDIKRRNSIVLENDKYYYRGGPQRLAARIIWGTPGFFRKRGEKLEDGAALLKDAISKFPNFTLSHLYLGDIYWEMGEKDLAEKSFNTLLSIPENAIKGLEAQNRQDKKDVKVLLKKYFGK